MSGTSDSVGSATSTSRKSHVRRESSGHLCTACDQCYRCKVRCSGERPTCERCRSSGSACTFSTGKPLGKPKGSKNKVQRTKTNPETSRQASHPQTTTTYSSPTRKRSIDGDLPPIKRTMSSDPRGQGGDLMNTASFSSPKNNSPEVPSLTIIHPSHLARKHSLAAEPYYSDSANPENTLHQILEQPTPTDMGIAFPSSGLNLDIDDFQWFSQSESYIPVTPSAAAIDVSGHSESLSGLSSYSTQTTMGIDQAGLTLDSVSLSPQRHHENNGRSPPCLCDPLSLGIISELHTLQLSFSPLDTALLLARRGLSTVSSYLACPSCLNHLSSSPSLFLACVLILQQVFTCYITLRLHGNKILSSLPKPEKRGDTCHHMVSIGEFEVEGEESCNVLLDAIVRAEMERGKGVIGGLEQWVEKVGDGREKMVGVLLQSLREEIGVV